MNKISLVLLTKDSDYANYFSNFLISSNLKEKFSSKIFTEIDTFKESTRNKKQHILLTDMIIDHESSVTFDKIITLSEEQISKKHDSIASIYKYQPFHELMSQVLAMYYEMNGKLGSVMNGKETDSVISFYSGNGGVGKTILSLCLAKHLSFKEKRVFYLSLEELHNTYLYFKQDKPSSAEVFYFLKKDKDQLIANIESLKSRDALTNIDYFSFPVLPEEMQLATEEDIETLIQAIRDTQNYDYIIVDLDSSIHARNRTALKNSDEVFWVLSSNETSFSSANNVMEHDLVGIGNDRSNIHFIVNNVGEELFDGFDAFNFSIEAHIPFHVHWLNKSEETKLQEDIVVGEQLFKLLKENTIQSSEVSPQWQ
ncbi:MAG: AAA family ATPase [Bacillota bacterium]|uniref:AAA family ATPase n=1 Tax=Virgibacillus sp. AGTR TaxID=2812055 RepID=UPI00041C05CD|nr:MULTISPECIES: AAA family ATPase [Bacillaceae]MCC2250977.1 AAA family ATPase [Virgibacillus sp. AGTR]QRZ19729.1 AAA family ATPase [Virgibacillus sp. AGTR]